MQNRLLRLRDRRNRPPRHPVALAGALVAAAAALIIVTAPAASASQAAASAAGFKITVRIANHTPVVGRRWPIELKVDKGRRRLSGTVRYQFMFAGVVVRTQPLHGAFKFKHGIYRDDLVFPHQSVGQPLTLRFLVRTRYGIKHADWALETRK
jgi:hypothetical protein